MTKKILALALIGLTINAQSQKASVEKSVFGIQTGYLGIWVHNETKLSKQIALRSEVGFDCAISSVGYYNPIGYLMAPVITAEPRWYYNLSKRQSTSKRMDGNSGNFISLKTSFHPNFFIISNAFSGILTDFSTTPTWGIRRNIGNHFNYETGAGVGYRFVFSEEGRYLKSESEVEVNLHLRFGYRF